jgi:hypothetical protein
MKPKSIHANMDSKTNLYYVDILTSGSQMLLNFITYIDVYMCIQLDSSIKRFYRNKMLNDNTCVSLQ